MSEAKNLARPSPASHTTGYASLLVEAQPELSSSHVIEAAARLAQELNAQLVGLAAVASRYVTDVGVYAGAVMAEVIEMREREAKARIEAAEKAFRRDAAQAELEWRSAQVDPTEAMVRAAATADLIVVGAPTKRSSPDLCADVGELVMRSGRPVLIVPEDARHLRGQVVVLAWNDTRECRRAVVDALPLLRRARDVIVHEVWRDAGAEQAIRDTKDIVAFLQRHGVNARPTSSERKTGEIAEELERVAAIHGADLIVAGAYGHPRVTEWMFGGVTATLMHRPGRFILLSH